MIGLQRAVCTVISTASSTYSRAGPRFLLHDLLIRVCTRNLVNRETHHKEWRLKSNRHFQKIGVEHYVTATFLKFDSCRKKPQVESAFKSLVSFVLKTTREG